MVCLDHWKLHRWLLYGTALLSLANCTVQGQEATRLEEPLCLGFVERVLFDAWRDIANKNGRPQKIIENVVFQEKSLTARDGTSLYGYRAFMKAAEPGDQSAVLIVPGNAMLADQLYYYASYFAIRGKTAYIFDYRGYGGSEGEPYAKAIIDDYHSILLSLADEGHQTINTYAMSFGGIVTLATLKDSRQVSALVLDGVPSELPWYAFCPRWLDPERSITYAPERTMVVSGSDDPVIPPDDMAELRERARDRGMETPILESFSHPGLDGAAKRDERLAIVEGFFAVGED